MTDEELDRHVWCPAPHRGEEPCDWCDVDAAVLAEMAKRSTSAQPSPGRVRSPNARFMSPVAGCCGGTDKHADTCAEPSSYKPTEDP